MLDPIKAYKKYKQVQNKFPEIKISYIHWFAFIITTMAGFNIVFKHISYGLLLILLALITSPPVLNLLNSQIKKRFKTSFSLKHGHMLTLFLLLLMLMMQFTSITNPSPTNHTAENTKVAIPTIKDFDTYTKAELVRIIDGDTIEVSINKKTFKVRYIGIDTPELNKQPEIANKAKSFNKQLLSDTIYLVKDVSETDKYGRLLRYVFTDTIFINAELVKSGWAKTLTMPPDVKFSDLFKTLEQEAQKKQLGIWKVYDDTQ